MEKRFLEIEVVGYKWKDDSTVKWKCSPEEFIKTWDFPHENIKEVHVQIKTQSHVDSLFNPEGKRGEEFKASNGIELSSYGSPAYYGNDVVFVLGDIKGYEDFRYEFSYSMFVKVYEAVQEYNAFYKGEEKMEECRFIELEVVNWTSKDGEVISAMGTAESYSNLDPEECMAKMITFCIKNQSHRCEEFNPEGDYPNEFAASNGIELDSYAIPDFSGSILFTRGSSTGRDNRRITVTVEEFKKIYEAVEEYNAFYRWYSTDKKELKEENMQERFVELKVLEWKNGSGQWFETETCAADIVAGYKNVSSIKFKIENQGLKHTEFNPKNKRDSREFHAQNGVEVSSYEYPEYLSHSEILFVQGTKVSSNNAEIVVSFEEFKKIYEAVEEYNSLYNEEEKMEKYLELEIVGKNEKFTAFSIKKQKLHWSNFKDFKASNGIRLGCSAHTCFGGDILWVQGSNKESHLAIMSTDNKTMTKLLEAVQEYNDSFNKKDLKAKLCQS